MTQNQPKERFELYVPSRFPGRPLFSVTIVVLRVRFSEVTDGVPRLGVRLLTCGSTAELDIPGALTVGKFAVTQIRVEFFGIPRARAGVAETTVAADTLGELAAALAKTFPQFGHYCIDGNQLRPGFTANLSGDKFTTDPAMPLKDGDVVLILSLDAGG